jgi:hypothetical protein
MISRVTGSPLVTPVSLLSLRLAFELVKSGRPERLQVTDHLVDCFWLGRVDTGASLATLLEQPGVPENGEVLGHRRPGGVESPGDVAGGHPVRGHELDDPATGWIGEGSERGIYI